MPLKSLISSPLEAGQSVLDAHRLPSHLDAALEYTARRLARKSLSIDLVVIRREYQLPQTATKPDEQPNGQPKEQKKKYEKERPQDIPRATAPDVPLSSKPLPPLPPTASAPITSTSRFASAFKGLVRSNTVPSLITSSTESTATRRADGKNKWSFSPLRSLSSASSSTSSPSFPSLSSFSSISSPLFSSASSGSPSTPSTPATPATPATPVTPATPSTDAGTNSTASSFYSKTSAGTNTHTHSHHASVSRSSSASSLSPASFGIRLVHADGLARTHKRVLAHILAKAALRFHLPPNWLPMPASASDLGLPASLVRRSVEQNQILFQAGSDDHPLVAAVRPAGGLVLRSLDHLYTFKAALCSYAQTGDRYRLEDAVDELRRYLLLLLGGTAHPRSSSRQSLAKRELLRQYPELACFTDAHIADVNRMYSRAYGGPEHECGIAADGLSLSPPPLFAGIPESVAEADEEQSTPTATAVDDSALIAINARQALASVKSDTRSATVDPDIVWSRPSLQSSTLPVPVLGMTRRTRRPTGMIFARPSASDELTIVDSAPPTASSLSSSGLSSVLSTPSSLPSLSLSMGSSVDDVMEHMLTMGQAEQHDNVSPLTPDTDDAKLDQQMPPGKMAVSVSPVATPAPTTILFRPAPRSPASPTARLPTLKLQTTFSDNIDSDNNKDKKPADDEEQLTARPASCVRRTFFFGGGGLSSSIGEVLGDVLGDLAPARGRTRRSADTILTLASPLSPGDDPVSAGPVPPRSYDDISPITRSEWGFLKGDLMGRQVTVTTF